MDEQKTFTEDYVKELREEAKQWRLKFKETENKLNEIQEAFSKKELTYQKQLEEFQEKLKSLEPIEKEFVVYKEKATKLEEKIKNDLLNKIPDEELKKQAIEKYTDIEQLEFFVNSLSKFTKNTSTKSTMDDGRKSDTSVDTEYINALKSGNVLKAIALKNKQAKVS